MNYIHILFRVTAGLLFLYLINISQLDSLIWNDNGRLFLEALKSGDITKTYIGPDLFHPGISILWLTSLIHLIFGWVSAEYLIVIQRAFFIAIFASLIFLGFKLWIKRWSPKLFFLSLLYVILSPYSVLWGSTTWLDNLLLFLTLPIILFWLDYLDTKNQTSLVLTGILIGFSILTKYIGVDRILIIVLVTLVYCYQNHQPFGKYFSSLIKVTLIAFITFVMLYPALWLNPQFVLFDRFNTTRSYQSVSYTHIIPSTQIYLKYLTKIDLVLVLGGVITFYQLIKKRISPYIFLSIGGLIHFTVLIIALLLLNDSRRGSEAFLSSIGRYQIASVWLLSPIYFDWILKLKYTKWLKFAVLGMPFLIELFFVYKMGLYPWNF
jgi:4-amino-4-deoxy-L-arabinose transferase-like glycosyltransferase